MSHFTRERNDAGYYRGYVGAGGELATVLRNIDEKSKKAISGTGGTWAPSSAIIIGGAGMQLQCGMQLTNATANPGAGKAFRFGDDDYFQFDAPVARTIDDSPLAICGVFTLQREARAWMEVASTITPALRTKHAGARLMLPLRIPDGSRLGTLQVAFKVGQSHANVPVALPTARVVRCAADGTIDQYPNNTTATRSPDGWVSPARPASGALWYAAGALQAFDITFDEVAGERADTSTYGYAVQWRDESGTDAFADDVGNYLVHLKLTVYQPDLRPY